MLALALHHIEKITLTDTEKLVNPGSGDIFWSRTLTVKYKVGEQSIGLFSNVSADALKISTPDPVRNQLVEALEEARNGLLWYQDESQTPLVNAITKQWNALTPPSPLQVRCDQRIR